MINLDNLTFLNEPLAYKAQDYEECLERVVRELKCHPEVLAICQIGEVSCPGVSDIDLLIVIDKDFRGKLDYLDVRKFSADDSYFFPHQLYIIPSSVVDSFNFLFPVFSIKTLYGQEIVKKESLPELDLLILTDMSVLRWPWEFLMPLLEERIENRRLLGRLISLRHLISLYRQISLQGYEPLELLVRDSFSLARDWFFKDGKERKASLVRKIWQAYLAIDRLLDNFSLVLKEKGIKLGISDNKNIFFVNSNRLVSFRDSLATEYKTDVSLGIWQSQKAMVSFLPTEFAFSLALYQKSPGGLGRYIKRSFIGNGSLEVNIPQTLKQLATERLSLLEKQLNFLGKNHLAFGYFMNFDYIYPFNFKYLVRNYIKTFHTARLSYKFRLV